MFIVFLKLYSTSTFLLVLLFYFLFSDIYYNLLHIFSYPLLLLTTNSAVFHFPPYPATSVSWCNQIISALNSSFFGIYTFLSFSTSSPSICHSSSHSIFISTFFISSTTLTNSLSLLLALFIFSIIFTSGLSITTSCKLYKQQFFINTWFLLFFSVSTF